MEIRGKLLCVRGAVRSSAAVLYLTLAALSALAADINVGSVFTTGTDTFSIQSQFSPGLFSPNPIYTFSLTIPAGTPASSKAGLIAAAAVRAGVPITDIKLFGNHVMFFGYTSLSGVNGTKEALTMALGSLNADPFGPTFASLGYGFDAGYTSLSGLDTFGVPAGYSAGFTVTDSIFGTISLSTTLAPGDLAGTALSDLLKAEYNRLTVQLATDAPAFTGKLSLDLSANAITFQFPATVQDASVTNNITDVSLIATEVISATPEPGSVWLMVTGTCLLLGIRRLQDSGCRKANVVFSMSTNSTNKCCPTYRKKAQAILHCGG